MKDKTRFKRRIVRFGVLWSLGRWGATSVLIWDYFGGAVSPAVLALAVWILTIWLAIVVTLYLLAAFLGFGAWALGAAERRKGG